MQTLKRFSLTEPTRTNGSSMKDTVRIGTYNGVTFEIRNITPAVAAVLLEQVYNRPLHKQRITKYTRIMKENRWLLNFEWIGLDESGCVIEGQHRLHACVESGVTIRTLVLSNLPRELFPFIGAGLMRGASDNLALAGAANANILAGALAYVFRAERGLPIYATGSGSRPDNDEVLALRARHPNLADSIAVARKAHRIYPSVGLLAYLHYEFSRRDAALADSFVQKLADGLNLRVTDPVYALRDRLIDHKSSSKQKLTNKYVMALTIKAWNYTRDGRRAPKFLRWSDGANESFPEIM